MIVYKDIIKKLADAGYPVSRLRKENIIPQSTLTRIRRNEDINTKTINTVCRLLNCKVEDILEYVEDI